MIKLTALNDKEFYLSSDLIEKIEATPDTVITITSGKKYIVKETPEQIIKEIIAFRRKYSLNNPEVIK